MDDNQTDAFVFLTLGFVLTFVVKPWYIGLPFLLVGFTQWLDNNSEDDKKETNDDI